MRGKTGNGDGVMTSKFIIEKADGLFTLRPVYEYLKQALDGSYRVEVKRVRKPRSNDQNGWLWGCIYPMLLDGLVDAGWEFTSCEQVHEFFKAHLSSEKVINKYSGDIIEFPQSTAEMDTATFSAYCEKLRDYASEYLGIDIPDPDKYWRMDGRS